MDNKGRQGIRVQAERILKDQQLSIRGILDQWNSLKTMPTPAQLSMKLVRWGCPRELDRKENLFLWGPWNNAD